MSLQHTLNDGISSRKNTGMTMNMRIRRNTGVTVLCLRGKKGDYRKCFVCWKTDDHIQPRVQEVNE